VDYPDEDKKVREKAEAQTQNFSKALATSEEYVKLLKFFGGELPLLILELCDVKVKNKEPINLGKVNQKFAILLKTYSTHYTALLAQAISEDSESSFLAFFFGEGAAIARIVSAHFHYHKKLALSLAGLIMNYASKLDKPSVLLAFNILLNLFPRKLLLMNDKAAL
jgi:hypothetical protein